MVDSTSSRRVFLSASAAAAVATPLLGGGAPAAAASAPPPPGGFGVARARARPQAPDRELRAILREIDAGRIRATVERLVAFGTRHTLSAQDDPVRGIGAARDWIPEQLTAYAAASGGRMSARRGSLCRPGS